MGDGAPKIFTKSFSRDAVPRSEPLSEYGNGDEKGYYEVRGKRYRVCLHLRTIQRQELHHGTGQNFMGALPQIGRFTIYML